jgi:hypothetical protein
VRIVSICADSELSSHSPSFEQHVRTAADVVVFGE